MSEVEKLLNSVKETADAGGTGKRVSWKGVLTVDPKLLGETGETAITFSLQAAKVDTDQPPVKIVKADRRNGQEVIGKEVVVRDGQIDLALKAERRYFTHDKFEPDSIKKGKNTFRPELVLAGTVEDIPAEHVASLQDGTEVDKFERVDNLQIESTMPLARIAEHKFSELYMFRANKEAKETKGRIAKLARTLLERDLALVCFFSHGRGYVYYTAVIHPYERKADGKLWLVMGLSEGRMTFDEAWSLAGEQTATIAPVPVIVKKSQPKVKISA